MTKRRRKSVFNVNTEFTGKWRKQQTFICSNYNFRHNEITALNEVQRLKEGKIISEYKPISDTIENDILLHMDQKDQDFSSARFRQFIDTTIVSIRYNPIEDYFNELPEWTGETDHIAELAATVDTDDNDLFITVLKKFLVGTVDGLIHHNKSNDLCLILQGNQGVGKSRWMKKLMPSHFLEDYFYEGHIDTKNKDHVEYLATKWLISLEELEAMRSNDVNALKAFITKQQINHRRVYDKYVTSFKRRASFVGSVNDEKFLTDTTGSRRWAVFSASEIDYQHEVDIDKVYAQALHLLQSGTFRHWLDKDEIEKLNERNERFSFKQKEEELVLKHFDFPDGENGHGEWMSSTEVIEHLSYLNNKTNVNLSSRIMGKALSKYANGKKEISRIGRYYLIKILK